MSAGRSAAAASAPAPERRLQRPRRRWRRIRTARRAWRTGSRRISPSCGRRRASATCRAAFGRTRMPAQNLNHFTATTGPAIVRGDALPADLKGDLLFTEPVGRLIRRAAIENIEGLTQLRNVYPERGVPDERRSAVPPGEHQQRAGRHALHRRHVPRHHPGAAVVGAGLVPAREDRAVPAGQGGLATAASGGCATTAAPAVPATDTNIGQPAIPAIAPHFAPPRMYSETPAQLVAHFTHPNGWWRDTAQRLLVLKQDKSVVPALQQMARSSDNLVARFHALWTLEGLGALDAALVREVMKDPNPAHAHPGDSRERDALQDRRQVVRRRLSRAQRRIRIRTSSFRRCSR